MGNTFPLELADLLQARSFVATRGAFILLSCHAGMEKFILQGYPVDSLSLEHMTDKEGYGCLDCPRPFLPALRRIWQAWLETLGAQSFVTLNADDANYHFQIFFQQHWSLAYTSNSS